MGITANLELLLAQGHDTTALRFALGNAYLGSEPRVAAGHFARAVAIDPNYSAAWKLLGKAWLAAADEAAARAAWQAGIAAAQRRGDRQAEREMAVFLKRLDRPAG